MLREAIATYQPVVVKANGKSKVRRRIDMGDGLYERLKAAAVAQGKPMTEVATAAIEAYLDTL
jgi:sulfite reductase (ferredoxin)